jgi:peptidoglycan/xylan/chitin deacetylase (PgdA/CDA1 family)
MNPTVFLYHRIAQLPEQHDPLGLAVLPELFEQQMVYLQQAGYQCLSLGEAVRRWRDGLAQPSKSFVLTFDDGYQDLYTNAWPVLERYGFTATVFLVTGRAGHESDWKGQTGPSAAPLLSWKEVRELSRLGLDFGSHTLSHPRLTSLDDEQAMCEILQSKAMIEDRSGVKIDLFSYPYSDFDNRIQRMVAESGYIAACGGDQGAWGLFNLWRAQCVNNEDWRSFSWKARGWHHRLIWLREQSCLGRPLRHIVRTFRESQHSRLPVR